MRILFGMFCSMDALILKQKEASLCSHQKKFRLKARIKKKNCQNGGYQFPKKIENIFLFYSSQNLNLRPSERNYTNKKTHQSQIDVTNFIFLLIIISLFYYFFSMLCLVLVGFFFELYLINSAINNSFHISVITHINQKITDSHIIRVLL